MPRRREPLAIGRVRRLNEARVRLKQHEAPHRLVDGGVLGVVLLDDETPEVRRHLGERRSARAHTPRIARTSACCSPGAEPARLRAMRLATLRDGTRDGTLVVVDRAGRCVHAYPASPARCRPRSTIGRARSRRFAAAAERLESGRARRGAFDPRAALAPLPRAYEWIDGSSYLNHVAARPKGAQRRASRDARDASRSSTRAARARCSARAIRSCCRTRRSGSISRASSPSCSATCRVERRRDDAAACIRLVMLANDVTYRKLVPAELAKGFGFFVSKPATAFSPVRRHADELGDDFRDGRFYLRLRSTYNGDGRRRRRDGPRDAFFVLRPHRAHRENARVHGRNDPRQRHGVESRPGARCLVSGGTARAGDDRTRCPKDRLHENRAIESSSRPSTRADAACSARSSRPWWRRESCVELTWRSSSAWRVRIGLALKGIAHELVLRAPLARRRRAAPRRSSCETNPMEQVPVLEVEGPSGAFRLTQSHGHPRVPRRDRSRSRRSCRRAGASSARARARRDRQFGHSAAAESQIFARGEGARSRPASRDARLHRDRARGARAARAVLGWPIPGGRLTSRSPTFTWCPSSTRRGASRSRPSRIRRCFASRRPARRCPRSRSRTRARSPISTSAV